MNDDDGDGEMETQEKKAPTTDDIIISNTILFREYCLLYKVEGDGRMMS